MPLSDDDVREILRLIDESDVEELRVETDGLSLYVRRSGEQQEAGPAETAPRADATSGSAAATARPTDGLHEIAAPMLGTFFRAPAPGATPFVEVGARVAEDTVVCLIEVMKMMNAVSAGVVGTVVEVCAVNAELVDPGVPLFRVRPEP
jgi:acetyl-CoA carboxylase biotin carboxyl carrier protein